MTSRSDRPYDIIVFGATSFVGEILCRYLVERHGTDGDLAWAIAGRNEAKLAALAKATGAVALDEVTAEDLADEAGGAEDDDVVRAIRA